MKDPFRIVYWIDAHSGRHYKSSLEEDGLFKSTAEAGLLVAETLTGVAVLSGAINSVTPVEVLVVAMVD